MRKPLRLTVLILACAAWPGLVFGFNGQSATEGPLTVTIADIPIVTVVDTPQTVTVTLANSSDAPLEVEVGMGGLADDCRAVGETGRHVALPARGSTATRFQFACGRATYSAHYPVHIRATFASADGPHTAHAVQVFQTDFSTLPAPPQNQEDLAPIRVPRNGAFALASLKTQRIAWSYLGEPLVRLPIGWTGADPVSAATFGRAPTMRGGVTRAALQLHPPYRPRAGTVFAEYRLRLPDTTPIGVEFFNAIRDSTPQEGASDGVTFRVWANDEKLFERPTDSKTWVPGEADLSAFAGKTITLRFESHPGPKNNTSCDSSFWGDPVIAVGDRPRILRDDERTQLFARARELLQGDAASKSQERVLLYQLDGDCRAVVALGPNGLADGVIGFGNRERQVLFAGLHMAVQEHVVGDWPSAALVRETQINTDATGRTQIIHRLNVNDRATVLTATIWSEGPALRIKVDCADPITGLGLNAADQKAPRVYYGHGYCIVEPAAFRATAGGHNLSTSHVGFDFEQGISLLTASDTPPDHLQVDPARHLYQLHTHPDATLTFVPGTRGALDCAVRYRPLYDKQPAPGVAGKAGRFVFDLWGGRYADNAAKLARCFDYGLTNSLVVLHTWQRWGYDYRLPDIFPPLPTLGTLAEVQELGRLCRSRGVLWGLHDNYIDIYPDAEEFSYDHITFTPEGKPRRAWLNESRDAQSYQFRPDRIAPFLQRNLVLIVPALHPTASFVDVFASLATFDFYDRSGNFHSKRETQRAWGEAFATIRNACGDNAPTISEAGGDYLIGWLDGADAQFMEIGAKPVPFRNFISCRDWERVPWFDAVNHTRFSLHGVGYSERYQSGRGREEHGIESDDYISAEILTGHALMIDQSGMGRGAVRKYWLAQDFIASVAPDEIRRVEFAEDDIHRVIVTWNSGARVHVNRGASDWVVTGHTLPQYGFWARHGDIEASIERFGPAIAEQARSRGKYYGNSRVFAPAAPLPVTPRAQRVDYLGDRKFKLIVDWDVRGALPKPQTVVYQFSRPTPGRRALTEFSGGGQPTPRTTEWRGHVTAGGDWTITIPREMPVGDYEILVALTDPNNRGQRERLLGDEDGRRRYRIGQLVVEGTKQGDVTGVRLQQPVEPYVASDRWRANVSAVDFGFAQTTGAFRCETLNQQLIVTPLPDGTDFELRLQVAELLGEKAAVAAVESIDAAGAVRGTVKFAQDSDAVSFTAAKGDFAYRIRVR